MITVKQIKSKTAQHYLGSVRLMPAFLTSRHAAFKVIIVSLLWLAMPKVMAEHGIRHTADGPVIELSAATLDAINSGVSLTFESEYAILNKWLFIEWPQTYKRHTFVISKHALSDRYLVHRNDRAIPSIFRSSSQGMSYITKSAQNLFQSYAQQKPELQLRISLSKFMLPAPIRLTAFTSNEWKFDSGWGTWQFEH